MAHEDGALGHAKVPLLPHIPSDPEGMRRFLELKLREILAAIDFIIVGSGSPEGAVQANVGHLYLRYDGGVGTTLYVKESGTGTTGWAAK